MNLYTEIKCDLSLTMADVNTMLRKAYYTKIELIDIMALVSDRFEINVIVKWLVNGSTGMSYPMILATR